MLNADSKTKGPPDLSVSGKASTREQELSQDAERPSPQIPDGLALNQRPTSFADTSSASRQEAAIHTIETKLKIVGHWVEKGRWPEEFCEQASQTRAGLKQENSVNLLATKQPRSLVRHERSEFSYGTLSEQRRRDEKGAFYTHPSYETLLASKGTFLTKSDLGITDASKSHCQTLLTTDQQVPQVSLFRDDLFVEACRNVCIRNQARVIRDITPLICPSAEVLAIYDNVQPKLLVDSVNESWDSSIPVTTTRPQPDYSVGFRRSAFTDVQLKKLEPFIGDHCDFSLVMATCHMYFPFLTCEAKGLGASLHVADLQNAHSMAIAVRGVVELFKYVKREKELHQELLAFSISHNSRTVRIYGHYALILGEVVSFYRHPIHTFDFTAQGGKNKWTAYKFTKTLYDRWMPIHFRRICSAIDGIPPALDFGVPYADFSISNADSLPGSEEMARSISSAQGNTTFKKPKIPAKAALRQEIGELSEKLKERDEQIMHQIHQLMNLQKDQMDRWKEQMERHMENQTEQMDQQVNQQREQIERRIEKLRKRKKDIMDLMKKKAR